MREPTPTLSREGFHKSETLWNRTFVGLLIAQFLAAFNDQCIHASAMFFAINRKAISEEYAINLMPILFFAPWAMFPTIAGYFADKYSKKHSLVFWKFAEIGITGLALFGFIVGSGLEKPNLGAWIVLSTVFLMGMHSTFFVPAKYGAMPEILSGELLSRGNGLLESLSFLATILGTVMGGVLSGYFNTQEYIIGLILVGLATIGALASLLIRRMPPANPNRQFMKMPWGYYKPLFKSLDELWQSRPLRFALVGIAFFTFMLAFMRGAVYLYGESRVPRWNEALISMVVGMTALGIGIGSPMAGYLSGKKVEFGLVPIGCIGMFLSITLAAIFANVAATLVICIVVIGFFTGFYLVPMFTQLQHRAPKERKGEVIATSNFVNVVGAILASLIGLGVVEFAHQFHIAPKISQEDGPREFRLTVLQENEYHRPVFAQIESEPGVGGAIGKPPNPKLVPPIWNLDEMEADDHGVVIIRLTQKAQVAWDLYERALRKFKEGKRADKPDYPSVRYSTYLQKGLKHYYVRRADEPIPDTHDNRELPRYMFLGASGMTLGALALLLWLLPDLLKRTRWLISSIRHERLHVENILRVPGHGPIILATDAQQPWDRVEVCWACDRRVHFVADVGSQDSVQQAERDLRQSSVIAISVNEESLPKVQAFLDRIGPWSEANILIIPVHAESSVVKFGEPLPSTTKAKDLLPAIQAARAEKEE
jgi:MFS family permease